MEFRMGGGEGPNIDDSGEVGAHSGSFDAPNEAPIDWSHPDAVLLGGGLHLEGLFDLDRWSELVTGWTEHGRERATGREGHGVNEAAMRDALNHPVRAYSDVERRTTRYVGRDASVVLNENGEVVTVWPRGKRGWRT
jgi:hypothetical protein